MQPQHRLLVIGLVILVTAGLGVHYGASYDDNWPHPSADELADDRGVHDGERVLLIGEVREVGDGRITMELETTEGETLAFDVRGFEADVEPGGVVQVYGPLTEDGTVQHAEEIVVVNRTPRDETYKLGVSGVAGLATAGLFLYYWRINLRELSFEVRHG